jgi:hypothetical protein
MLTTQTTIGVYKTKRIMRKGAIKKVARLAAQIEDIIEDLNEILENEQAYFDERSDEWQEGEKGEEFQDRLYALEEFKDALENAVYDVNDTIEG